MTKNIDVSKEACAARNAYRIACVWCYDAVTKTFEEFEMAVQLRQEAFKHMENLGLVDESMRFLEQSMIDDLRIAIRRYARF